MLNQERREAVRQFVNRWKDGGDEKQDCHPFWIELLHDVLGVENPTSYIRFEKKVKLAEGDGKIHTRYIDGYIADVHVLIEQKGSKHPLDEKEPQSGGELLTPYEQAKRYDNNLPKSDKADWIVTCNFREIWIYNMNTSVPEPEKINILELQDKYKKLDFLVKRDVKEISHEMQVSIQAGDIVGQIYDAFMKQYGIPEKAPKGETPEEKSKREHKLRSLNALCVRLVFLLYAEDADIFQRDQFLDYMRQFSVKDSRRALIDLFKVLDTPVPERDEYLEEDLAAFPYVNGGLFADENIEIPPFNEELRRLLLEEASEGFDWKDISPTIFGAVFESTLNPETRRAGGMHYTSVENIHKVIDPLFLDGLKEEFQEIRQISVPKTRDQKLRAFQDKLASLTFLDPAAGSGNFLTESYLSLRRLENEVLRTIYRGTQIAMGTELFNPIKVSIQQFYGIEINDFAVTVAKTALWIAESQMLEETKETIYGFDGDFLPLKTYVNITEGNALRIDWNDVIPAEKLNYIMGNPPFVGNSRLSDTQKQDRDNIFNGKGGELDYVCCWYRKATDFIRNTKVSCAFVSTNSICQGQQVLPLWKPLFHEGLHIDFAHKTFVWDSEASIKAHVYCIIVGFSFIETEQPRIFEGNKTSVVTHINAYLSPAEDIFVEKRKKAIFSGAPIVIKGFQPTDNGYLILNDDEKDELIKSEPKVQKWIRPFITAREYINQKNRWCLWLVGASPTDIRTSPEIKKRVSLCKEWREQQKESGDAYKLRNSPTLMRQNSRFKESDFIVLPRVTGERRRYIPFGFVEEGAIPGDSIMLALDANKYHFGILCSNVHMSWMRTVAGRLKGDYRYSSDIVYNTFPWPTPSPEQKAAIEKTAQGILDARDLYPESSLADLYDPLTMPPELRKSHVANDRAVMAAYGFSTKMSESDCVAKLMQMYQQLTAEENSKKK